MKALKISIFNGGRRILDLLGEFLYLAIIFFIPLYFAYWFLTYQPFELNKSLIFKSLVCLLGIVSLLNFSIYRGASQINWGRQVKKYYLWPLIFIFGLSLCLFWWPNPLLSFYGTIERQAGLQNYLYYFIWFILLSFNLLNIGSRREKYQDNLNQRLQRLLITIFVSATLVSLYAILQFVNIDFLTWVEPAYLTRRAFSTLGQPNFLASWLLLTIPLAIYLSVTERRFWFKFIYFLGTVFQLAGLLASGSRGGVVALGLGFLLLSFYSLRKITWSRVNKLKLIIGVLISLSIFLIVFDFVSGGRLRDILKFDYGSSGARINIYQASVKAISHRPWGGYGLDNGAEALIPYYLPDWGVYGNVGQIPDRAHNLFLDILLSSGLYGLGLFIIFYYFFFSLVRRNLQNKLAPRLSLALGFAALVYLLSLLFSFSFVVSELYFWSFLAILVAISAKGETNYFKEFILKAVDAKKKLFKRVAGFFIKFLLIITALGLFFLGVYYNMRALRADFYFNEIYLAFGQNNYSLLTRLYGYWRQEPINSMSRISYAQALVRLLSQDQLGALTANDQEMNKKIIEDLDGFLTVKSSENLLTKALISQALGNFPLAYSYFNRLETIGPHWTQVDLERGRTALRQGDYLLALSAFERLLTNLPVASDYRLNDLHRADVYLYYYLAESGMAQAYFSQGQYELAGIHYQKAYDYQTSDYTLLKKIADTYYLRGDLTTAIKYNLHGFARSPKDYAWALALASLYQEQANSEQALKYIQLAKELAPDNRAVNDFLEKIMKNTKSN